MAALLSILGWLVPLVVQAAGNGQLKQWVGTATQLWPLIQPLVQSPEAIAGLTDALSSLSALGAPQGAAVESPAMMHAQGSNH